MMRGSLLLAGLAACTGTPSATEGTSGSTGTSGGEGAGAGSGAGDQGGHGGEGGQGGGGAGGPAGDLVDRGLVARYFIDEADRGTAPTSLDDAASEPLALDLLYDTAMSFGGGGQTRGLAFSAVGANDRATAPIAGTKILTRLVGKTQATLEVVVSVEAVSSSASRLLHLGTASDSGALTLSSALPDRVHFYWHASHHLATWPVALGPDRVVVHAVLETDAASEPRVRGYANGSFLAPIGGTPPDAGEVILLTSNEHLVIGNRESGSRTPLGIIFYAAIYDTALTPSEILHNVERLLVSDDATPGGTSPP